ncbi:MAG: GIY-YIG nuclease family protein [Opitutaceae bacterium]|nr:GIY-YIG nuclease family protein [Opitutaceae bacterium]
MFTPRVMHYVYLLRSVEHPDQTYVGYTADLRARFATHNAGEARHTAKFRPWRLVTYLAFSTKTQALAFETYLKSHSGKAFAAKRLW